MYSAMDVAKYIISFCTNRGNPISNLKLQKMLYFIWIDFFNETKEMLFQDNICAWQLGPVVPDVYYEFCSFAGIPITRTFYSMLSSRDSNIVDHAIEKLLHASASSLVDKTHRPGTPWDVVYRDGKGLRDVIPFRLIISLECKNEN